MSNKTPAAKKAKTGSAPKRKALLTTAIFVIFLGAAVGNILISEWRMQETDDMFCLTSKDPSSANNCSVMLESVFSHVDREKGLSGRDSMGDGQGMIFIFDNVEKQCIWMKDMRFDIDILWLDQNKKILNIARDVAPNTYPQSFCQNGSKYVLELRANKAGNLDLHVGDTADVKL